MEASQHDSYSNQHRRIVYIGYYYFHFLPPLGAEKLLRSPKQTRVSNIRIICLEAFFLDTLLSIASTFTVVAPITFTR